MNGLPRHLVSWMMFGLFLFMGLTLLMAAETWPWRARIVPLAIVGFGLVCAVVELVTPHVGFLRQRLSPSGLMDLTVESNLPAAAVRLQAGIALGWLVLLIAGILLIGFYMTTFTVVLAYLRWKAKASWLRALVTATVLWTVFFFGLGSITTVPWPDPLLLQWF